MWEEVAKFAAAGYVVDVTGYPAAELEAFFSYTQVCLDVFKMHQSLADGMTSACLGGLTRGVDPFKRI
jgi:hypothetical protein